MDKISVIIPAYNSSKTIRKCLDSILKQTIKNIEIIVVNDGSKDNTLDILNEYKKKYKNIIVIDKKNEGQAAARNDGYNISTGNYINFMDADDFIEKDYLEKMYKAIKKDGSDFSISGFKNYNVNYKLLGENKLRCYDDIIYHVYPWARLYKKEFLENNNIKYPNIRYAEDNAFTFLAAQYAKKVSLLYNNTGYCYYYNTESLTKTSFKSYDKTDVIPYIEYLLKNSNEEYIKNNERFYNYVIIKQAYNFVIYAGHNDSPKRMISKNKEVKRFLLENMPYYRKHRIIGLFFPKSDYFRARMGAFIYTVLNTFNLVWLFALIYCKPKKK